MALNALFVLSLICFTNGDWEQQYGDPWSTNYASVASGSHLFNVTGPWNYTNPGQYSYIYGSPAVSEQGVVFFPFLKYSPPTSTDDGRDLQVRAAAPNGSIMWVADNLGNDEKCAVIFLTNAVYSSKRKMVFIAWTCAAAFPYYEKHGQIIGINSLTGAKVWKSHVLTNANDLSRMSISSNIAYVSGGYDCWKDGLPLKSTYKSPEFETLVKSKSGNISKIYAFNLDTGDLLWVRNHTGVGCTSQTKILPLDNSKDLVIFPVELPRNVYLGGKLLALECDSQGSCSSKWLSDVGVCWGSTFGFSRQGVLFGGYGFDGKPDLIFGLDINTGMTLFSNMGYCLPGVYPSGPAVDKQGHAYYSCGNRVFAVDSTGRLLWKTDILEGSPGYIFYSDHRFPPAIVPLQGGPDVLVMMNTNSTHLFGLSANNGTVLGSYEVPVLDGDNGVNEPPFIAGNRLYWIKAQYYIKFYLFSIEMDSLIVI